MTKREQKIFNDHYMAAMEKALNTGAEDDLKIAREIKKLKEDIEAAVTEPTGNVDGE